jgi:hypothetical protein
VNPNHVESLSSRHARLEAALAAEARRPMPDSSVLGRLKREKLRVKEAISRTIPG